MYGNRHAAATPAARARQKGLRGARLVLHHCAALAPRGASMEEQQ
jgi:hypothetical protein